MTTVEKRELLEMINLCVKCGLFHDMESKQIWDICCDAMDRNIEEHEMDVINNETTKHENRYHPGP